ncbi:MAG: primosomal protein N' [Lautropia sp.]
MTPDQPTESPRYVGVWIDGPLAGTYDYALPAPLDAAPGDWVVVPWGRSRRIGLVADCRRDTALDPQRVREVETLLTDRPAMGTAWLDTIRFAASYYHAEAAELAHAAVPRLLRTPPTKRTRRTEGRLADFDTAPRTAPARRRTPNPAQQAVLDALRDDTASTTTDAAKPPAPWLLQGITGSGKTEVYLHWIEHLLEADPSAQVLVLVPEIGLTPALHRQLQERLSRFPIAVLHSAMTDAERTTHWLAAATGRARIVLGTRLAALAPIPSLAAIVIDEEHDASFKQQEGVRYSARDLAVARAAQSRIPILLGSATPSLESWRNARQGRYRLLRLADRATGARLPRVRCVSLREGSTRHGLTEAALAAIRETLDRREQALLFLNRRGYSPVLTCNACGWLSGCDQCDAWRVLHRVAQPTRLSGPAQRPRYRLICHHCAAESPAPHACPDCGNQDLSPIGRGTQRLEEGLATLFPSARIGRLDRDVASRKGATERFLASVHEGDLDLLIGTQMLAKGHDFERLTLVVVVDADAGLFASDFRAPERLFATLMQVSGRAGRHRPEHATTLVQTRFPEHPLFESLIRQDYDAFADRQLDERVANGLPPASHQALLLAQARQADVAIGFLQAAADAMRADDRAAGCTVCDPIPMPVAQIRGVARAQLLVESASRPRLHAMLTHWRPMLAGLATGAGGGLRWSLVVDPIEI